jgi:AcrR family transcriptional regulator
MAKQPTTTSWGRANQRRRTRKDLLSAAARLLKAGGRPPDMDAVAAEAMVSRATAYRYFPSIETLLTEAPLDGAFPDPAQTFADDPSTDPAERVDRAEALLHDMVYRNEPQLRLMVAASLERKARTASGNDGEKDLPVRQNRRTALIEAALAPARKRLTRPVYANLCAALALLFGPESMIVFSDVLNVDARIARRVKAWAARALVKAALEESQPGRRQHAGS